MKPAYSSVDTIAAVATPPGTGAIGIVRLSGPQAIHAASSLIYVGGGPSDSASPSPSLEKCRPRQMVMGVFHNNGTNIDKVMVTLYKAPHSYTGEDVVEIYCHGGPIILKEILDLFLRQGLRHAEPGEFSQRAFLNGKMDLAQAEAVADIISAKTEQSRAAAWSQMQGELSDKVRAIRESLIEILAHIEVALDHSDDPTVGTAMSGEETSKRLTGFSNEFQTLLDSYEYGRLLKEGARIAIVGRPNVGKSSLLNMLLGSDRAIVTDVPGTTRDTLEEGFDLLGIPAVLIDTAGIRGSSIDAVEKIGMERARRAIGQADVVLAMFDQSEILSEADKKIAELVGPKSKKFAVLNKSDLPTKISAEDMRAIMSDCPSVKVSSLKGDGIQDLIKKLKDMVSMAWQEAPLWVTSVRHRDCLARAMKSIDRARLACGQENMEECAALEIREGLDSLGELVGETVTEDILKEVFSKFCVGK